MVRVFLLSHGFQQEYEVGYANGLAAHGDCEVTLISSENTLTERLAPNVKVLQLRGSQRPGRGFVKKSINMVRYWVLYLSLSINNRDAIFHFNGLFSMRTRLMVLVEAVLAWMLIRKWVLSVHNIVPHESEGTIDKLLYRFVYKLPGLLVVHTELMRQVLISDFDVCESRIVVVEHGIDVFSELPYETRAHARHSLLGIDDCKKVILSFGKVMRYKGLEEFIEAFARYRGPSDDWILVIAGKCDDVDLRNSLRSRIVNWNLSSRVVWLDRFIESSEVEGLLCAADVMIMPYRHIDQSGVIFSALSFGLPVVATDVGSLKHYVPLSGGAVVGSVVSEDFIRAIRNTLHKISWLDRGNTINSAKVKYGWRTVLTPLISSYSNASCLQ